MKSGAIRNQKWSTPCRLQNPLFLIINKFIRFNIFVCWFNSYTFNYTGNIDIQMRMLNHLKDKKDVGFFTSIAGLMNSCSVLDLDAFERNTKAEGYLN